jgi:hypothetical protein
VRCACVARGVSDDAVCRSCWNFEPSGSRLRVVVVIARCRGDWEIGERGMTSSKEAELLCGEALPWKCFKSDQDHKVEFFDNVASSSGAPAVLDAIWPAC